MIKNIIFDYGGVLLDWNPRYLYDPYFGDKDKAEWFLQNICTYEWNAQHDNGKPVAEGTAELIAEHPEWEKEIRMYYDDFMQMMGGQIPGMEELIKSLKAKGYHVFGLSNWSEETFSLVRHVYPVLDLMEDMVISGIEHVMKPDYRIFELALKRFGIKAEETAFIDDNPNNVKAACEMGIKGIHFQSVEQLSSMFYLREYTPQRIEVLKPNEIFVFGSNLAGSHGGGAARLAYNRFGAIWGQGVGLQGQSYGIPTMHGGVEVIKPYVDEFVDFARNHPEYKFLVTRVGCGIAGFSDEEIAPLFKDAIGVENVILPKEFVENNL